ncbi:DUF3300 domain-containing protein [Glaciecola petra]|uniref:DUF3300 domain-containing protein n=1 Tax=Glaciecola petra TaxID=3075602 RepID=A0ABU2ZL21_9ALTE|nr:DUF3300 domain-containing protein [Aestuariibacter sp. P117]MDT0593320.1 DUF3300 domain-containing protein [Aestuariibacter sp. P117]
MNRTKLFKNTFLIAVLNLAIANIALADNQQNYQVNAAQFSQAELAQILAPIALYPDSLLTHIMIASTYPLELVQAQRWQQKNDHLDAASAVELAEKEGWDPSVTALVAFPNVLERLNDDLAWTQNLGDAFLEDEVAVLDAVQDLRQQAEQANSLQDLKNMQVTKVNKQIIIEPVQKEIIYVPYYDSRVVYGNWHWRRYPPVYWNYRPRLSVHFPLSVSGHFHWNVGINIRFNYFFRAFDWHRKHIVVTHHRAPRYANKYTSRYLSSRHRVTTSHGAKRWKHNASHRRNVVYRSERIKSRYEHTTKKRGYKLNQQKYKQHKTQKIKQGSRNSDYTKLGQHQRVKSALGKRERVSHKYARQTQAKRKQVQHKQVRTNNYKQAQLRHKNKDTMQSKNRVPVQPRKVNTNVKRKQSPQQNRMVKKPIRDARKSQNKRTKKRTKKRD